MITYINHNEDKSHISKTDTLFLLININSNSSIYIKTFGELFIVDIY